MRSMNPMVCVEENTQWCRIYQPGAVRKGRGKRNQFDGSEWLNLCSSHAFKYEEWAQTQACGRVGCNGYRDGKMTEQGMEGIHHGEEVLDGWLPHLARVMNLQERVRECEKYGVGQKEGDVSMERTKSDKSSASDLSSRKLEDGNIGYPMGLNTHLRHITPTSERSRSGGDPVRTPDKLRRVSDLSHAMNDKSKANVPRELTNAAIEPEIQQERQQQDVQAFLEARAKVRNLQNQ